MTSIASSSAYSSSMFSNRINSFFQSADADASGGISLDEFKKIGAKKTSDTDALQDLFSAIDSDGDGQVTSAELNSYAAKEFKSKLSQGGALSGDTLLQAASNFANGIVSKVDTDGDGAISLDEFKAAKPDDTTGQGRSAEDIFKSMDTDGDGKLTTSEIEKNFEDKFTSLQNNMVNDFISKADSNGDGSINLDEFKAADSNGKNDDGSKAEALFKQLDTDGDGKLSADEIRKGAEDKVAGAVGGPPGGGRAHQGHRAHGGGGADDSVSSLADDATDSTSAATFDPLDTNQDGVVSAEERAAGSGKTAANMNLKLGQMLSSLLNAQEQAAA